MATLTATLYANAPKAVHAGVNAIVVNYNSGAVTASAGDVLFLAKLPHGARILYIEEDHSTGATANSLSLGLAKGGPGGTATLSLLLSAVAQATKNRYAIMGIPPVVSVSDADGERWGILAAKLTETGTATVSLIVNVTCLYITDNIT